jgi:hypothetical protein
VFVTPLTPFTRERVMEVSRQRDFIPLALRHLQIGMRRVIGPLKPIRTGFSALARSRIFSPAELHGGWGGW